MVSQRLIRIIGEFFFKMGKEADYIPLGGYKSNSWTADEQGR